MEECEAKYAIFSGIETNETVNMGEKPYYDVFICAEKHLKSRYRRNLYLTIILVIRFQNFIVNVEKQLKSATI